MTPDNLTEGQRATVAEELAEFLISLHTLNPGPGLSNILPHEDARLVAEQYLFDAEVKIVPKLSTAEAQTLRQLLESYIAAPDNFLFRAAVLHADFSADHILLTNGGVQGVLDFGDVSWGDPDYDFMYLFVRFGNTFVEGVAKRYGHPDLDRLRRKDLYFGVVDQISTIIDGNRALVGQIDEAWFRLEELLKRA
jgi:aminoglycoside phosphotransferase (APT) family kinase protein